jgi:hypothetical protein
MGTLHHTGDRHGANIWGKTWIDSCTHQLTHTLHSEEAYLLRRKHARISCHTYREMFTVYKHKTHTSRPVHCSCDFVKQAVTYQGFCSTAYIHLQATLDRDNDTPTANESLITIHTNYSDTNHDSIKFALLPNVLTNSFPPSQLAMAFLSTAVNTRISWIYDFNQGVFTCIASKEGTQPTLISYSNDRWRQSTVWFQLGVYILHSKQP